MDRGLHVPPRIPPPNPLVLYILVVPKENMRQFLIVQFGVNFYRQILALQTSVVIPIVTYGEEWRMGLHVLF